MDVDIGAAILRHHKTEALLIIEEFDLAFDHHAGWPRLTLAIRRKTISAMKSITTAIAVAKPVAAGISVAPAEPVTTAKAVTAPEPVTPAKPATMALGTRSLRFGCARVDAVHGHHLQSARRLLEIADHRRARGYVRGAGRSKRRSVTERIAAV